HTACPIPAAILKAIEVEVGIALPKDVTITFSSLAVGDAPTGDAYDGGENVGPKEE
ncbi:MAG: hypothetical protein HY679_10665, partial [Chloroflexi bacterium]|nr:hypothetical protein [Chloroflexota bacterium]